MKKRPRSVPPWDDYFMALCFFIAARSKDPNTQHGAIIVDAKHRIQGTGYNGPAAGFPDADLDWSRPDPTSSDPIKRAGKYPFIIHAEANAIDHVTGHPDTLEGSTLYVTGPPCSECIKKIIPKKIKKIVYGPQASHMVDTDDWTVTKEHARLAKLTLERYAGNLNWLRDRVAWMDANTAEIFEPQLPLPL